MLELLLSKLLRGKKIRKREREEQLKKIEESKKLWKLRDELYEYGIDYVELQKVGNPRLVLNNNGVWFSDYDSEGNPNEWANTLYEYTKLYYKINHPGKYAVVEIDENFNLKDIELSILKQLEIGANLEGTEDLEGEIMKRIDSILNPETPVTFIVKVDMVGAEKPRREKPDDINRFQNFIRSTRQSHQQEVTTIVFLENGTRSNMSNNFPAVSELTIDSMGILPYDYGPHTS